MKVPSEAKYKVVGFDLDGTLCDFQNVMRPSLKFTLDKILEKFPEYGDSLTIEKMIEIRNQVAEENRGKLIDLEEVRLGAFRRTLKRCGVVDEELAVSLNELYLKHRFGDASLFDEVLFALERLRQRYLLCVVSNGNSYPRKLGLEKYFEFIILSQDVGIQKPDRRIFALAIHKADVCQMNSCM